MLKIVDFNQILLLYSGTKVVKIGITKLPSDTLPMLMYSGEVTLATSLGKLNQITLTSHEVIGNIVDNKRITELFETQLLCRRYMT